MAGEHYSSDSSTSIGPFLLLAEFEPKTFRQVVRETLRPLYRSTWYSLSHLRVIWEMRDHMTEIVEQGGITSPAMQAAMLDELGFSFAEDAATLDDAMEEVDQRDTEGKRAFIALLGRVALLPLFHYLDPTVLPRFAQMALAPDKLAHRLGQDIVRNSYHFLESEDQAAFEIYEGRISRFRALRLGLPQAAVLGSPQVFAIHQKTSPVTLVWAGDETRPNLAEFSMHYSTDLVTKLMPKEVRESDVRAAA